ncbi:hypothetical protein ScPMuIL_001679 [Solemya velum]
MAPIGERRERMGQLDADAGDSLDAESQNLWATVLSEVQSSSASKLPTTKSILVLGDNECGKTTIIAKVKGADEPRKGAGLEYYYIDVRDEYRDEQAKLGVWALDGDVNHTGLLRFAVTEESFEHTMVILVASMATPWNIMDSLNKWAVILQDHIDSLKLKPKQRAEYEQSMIQYFQEYTEPDGSQQLSTTRRDVNPLHPQVSVSEEDKVLLPLGDDILTKNLGIPIAVVITKSDAISSLEKEHDYKEEHFDFIQSHIRKFCLQYGAALFYTSVKEEKNCDLLYKYLVHRIYGFPFSQQAYVVERDCVFVPTGWDNEKKVSILYENFNSMKPDFAYDDVILKPVTRKPVQKDAEVVAEDEQVFLMKQQTHLAKQPAAGGDRESPMRSTVAGGKGTPTPRATSTPIAVPLTSSPKKLDGKNPATSEGMLANFFNSLLNKKPGATPAGTKADKAVTQHAAAELERLTRSKKTVTESNPNGPSPPTS